VLAFPPSTTRDTRTIQARRREVPTCTVAPARFVVSYHDSWRYSS